MRRLGNPIVLTHKNAVALRRRQQTPRQRKMILTNCAACAAPLAHNAPRCVPVSTRYCNKTCQHATANRSKACEKYTAAATQSNTTPTKNTRRPSRSRSRGVSNDTKGQTCFICTQALHWKTKGGLVRGCACRGTAGFAHVSCLAEQAKILVAEAEENNLDDKVLGRGGNGGSRVVCASKTTTALGGRARVGVLEDYVGRPETDQLRANCDESSLGMVYTMQRTTTRTRCSVQEAELSMNQRRTGAPEEDMLVLQTNRIAATYAELLDTLKRPCT